MGEERLARAPHRVGRNQEKTHDGTIVTDKVNEMWGTDMSQTVTLEEGRAYVFVAVEHANSEIIGIHAARQPIASRRWSRSGRGASVLRLRRARRGAWAQAASRSWLRFMSDDFQGGVKCLGIEASPSFVREPEGNGVAERFIRTLKENCSDGRTSNTIDELPAAELAEFARRYNETWLVARHGYKTPARVREEQTMQRSAIDPTLAASLPWAA